MKNLFRLASIVAVLFAFAPSLDAQVTVIQGSGCTGSPDCAWGGSPMLGQQMKVGGVGCGADLPLLSLGIELMPPVPLPAGITCLPNCFLAGSLLVNFPMDTVVFTIPMDRSLVGGSFVVNCACVTASPFCVQFARALRVTIQ